MECTHKHPPMHTHIYLKEGFGLGYSFSRNKNKCQKKKMQDKPEHGELHKQEQAHTYTHTVEAVSQSGLSSQLQLCACWVCFPWVQTWAEPHRFQAYVKGCRSNWPVPGVPIFPSKWPQWELTLPSKSSTFQDPTTSTLHLLRSSAEIFYPHLTSLNISYQWSWLAF